MQGFRLKTLEQLSFKSSAISISILRSLGTDKIYFIRGLGPSINAI